MPAISVIMPVYNSEKYLHSAIDSVLKQTFRDFELILIDDGSKDSSGIICDKYAQADSRVTVIHQDNTGLCGARNVGIKVAKGNYLAFIDNDDLYMPTLLEDNYALAIKYQADMVKFGRARADINGESLEKVIYVNAPDLRIYEGDQVRTAFFDIHGLRIFDYVWDGLYNASIFRKYQLYFDEFMRFGSEDSKMTYQFYQYTTTLVVNPQVYYLYFKRLSHSVSARFDQNIIDSLLKVSDLQYEIWQHVFSDELPNSRTILLAMSDLITILQRALLHKSCPYSFAEKKRLLCTFRIHPAYEFSWNRKISKQVRAVSKPKWVMAVLYAHGQYGLLLTLSKIYLRYIHMKQRQTIRRDKLRFERDLESIAR